MHLHRAHLSPVTKTRFVIGAAVLVLVVLASTSRSWLLPFVEFAGSHSTHIEAIAALVQIVLWGGAGVLALVQVWGLRRRQGPAQDLTRVTERYLEHLVDRYRHLDPAERARREDPAGPGARVLLGGSYLGSPTDNRCTVRLGELPTLRDKLIGFRVAVVPE